ncbi:acylphosphatase [Solimonas sp. K1W22B-7]|nr:acylphosphatase [Solimonas sp. K1W22B-7]
MRECYRFIVSGRVQGVFFRQSTADKATSLGLDGWVRNLPDGRVEGMAAGPAEALAGLRAWLDRGPPAARVEAVEWGQAEEVSSKGFAVRR